MQAFADQQWFQQFDTALVILAAAAHVQIHAMFNAADHLPCLRPTWRFWLCCIRRCCHQEHAAQAPARGQHAATAWLQLAVLCALCTVASERRTAAADEALPLAVQLHCGAPGDAGMAARGGELTRPARAPS